MFPEGLNPPYGNWPSRVLTSYICILDPAFIFNYNRVLWTYLKYVVQDSSLVSTLSSHAVQLQFPLPSSCTSLNLYCLNSIQWSDHPTHRGHSSRSGLNRPRPWGQIWPASCVCKHFPEHIHPRLYAYYLCCSADTTVELSNCDQGRMVHKPTISTIRPFTGKVCQPLIHIPL